MFITPGPNNTMLTISGIKFGFKRTIPHIFGISIGHAFQISIICLGLGVIFQTYPLIQVYLKWLCLTYLFYLAWKMIGSIKHHEVNSGRPLKFIEASMFQWVNPKAWTISSMAASGFLPAEGNLIISIIFIATVALIVCPISISPWAAFGSAIRNFVKNNKIKALIEYFLAFLLLITSILIVIQK